MAQILLKEFPVLLKLKKSFFDTEVFFIMKSTSTMDLPAIFIRKDYDFLEVLNKKVIDIGAAAGDTSVYFALRGALKVFAYEPYPWMFELAKLNVKINNLDDKVMLYNMGLGRTDGNVTIKGDEVTNTGTSLDYGINKGKDEIPIVSLRSIIERHEISNGVLKVDCEGCEYETILHTDSTTLRNFSQIEIEFHNGFSDLKEKLESAGFSVHLKMDEGKFNHNIESKLGYIYCTKIE